MVSGGARGHSLGLHVLSSPPPQPCSPQRHTTDRWMCGKARHPGIVFSVSGNIGDCGQRTEVWGHQRAEIHYSCVNWISEKYKRTADRTGKDLSLRHLF